jgi:uncharacterized protein YlxW (UPF0749 family)
MQIVPPFTILIVSLFDLLYLVFTASGGLLALLQLKDIITISNTFLYAIQML